MAKIFISHSSSDNAEAVALLDWLEAAGWNDVFLDLDSERGIKVGQRWQNALKEEVDNCELVILLLSKAWTESRWCLREFYLAQSLHKRIFGVIVNAISKKDLPNELTSEWQVVDLTSGDCNYERSVQPPPGNASVCVRFSELALEKLKIGLSAAGINPDFFRWPPEHDPERPPYRGLRPLEKDDAGIFFGRDAPIISGLDKLRSLRDAKLSRCMVILGASGAGKSSFMRAGLLPRLERDDLHFLPLSPIRPQSSAISGPEGFLASLAQAFKEAKLPESIADINAAVNGGASAVGQMLHKLVLAKCSARIMEDDKNARLPTLVLPIDQAEELFLPEGKAEANDFFMLLKGFSTLTEPELIVLMTIRSDQYDRIQNEPLLADMVKTPFDLSPMPRGAYADVIKGPANRLDKTDRPLDIGKAVVEMILKDIDEGGVKDALPLLAFTLERLYLQYGLDGDLTVDEYELFGGINGAIDGAIKRALQEADANPQIPSDKAQRLDLLRIGLIPRLAGVDAETGSPRRRVAKLKDIPKEARPLIDCLVDQHLLATDVSEHSKEVTIEPAHEVFLREWSLLREWLKEDAPLLNVQDAIMRAAREWQQKGRDPSWLVHIHDRLSIVEQLSARPDLSGALEQLDEDYILACRAETKKSIRIARLRQATLTAFVVSIIIGLVAWVNQGWIIERFNWFTVVRPFIKANVEPEVLTIEKEQNLHPGNTFKECIKTVKCPKMVVIRKGHFVMGSPEGQGDSDEHPPRTVNFSKQFAVSETEVTFAQWNVCVSLNGCRKLFDSGFGEGARPVINATWLDAEKYASWLSEITGKKYRLLSEAEWEYSARAGTTTLYSFNSDDPNRLCNYANVADDSLKARYPARQVIQCNDNETNTARVRNYVANPYGLYDMHGNVWEWVKDCHARTYEDAPTDGSWVIEENCASRVIRGGSFDNTARNLTSASRHRHPPGSSDSKIGFRVMRELLPPRASE